MKTALERSNVLVTGAAGFIGSHVVDHLVHMGANVVAVDDLSGGFMQNVNPAARFMKGSVLDEYFIDHVFDICKPDYVYHLAAYAAEGLSFFIPRFNYENNLIGSINLINASVNHNVKCFVFTSSIAVYGHSKVLPVTEKSPTVPADPYGISKLAVEQHLHVMLEQFDLNHIIFRPHNVYGPGQNIGDRYRNVIGIFMNQVMSMQPMTIFGNGEQTRAFSYIDDVAPIIAFSPQNQFAYNETFNIGSDNHHSINDLADTIAVEFGVEPRICYEPERNEVNHIYASHEKLKKYFWWSEETPLADGIHRMAEWARQHGVQSSKSFSNIEIERNLPPSWRKIVD